MASFDTSFNTAVGAIEPVDAGELSIAGRSYSSVRGFDQFENDLVVGNVAYREAGKDIAKNMITGQTAPQFLGVVLRKLGSAHTNVYKFAGSISNTDVCPYSDPIADICQEGKVTVNAKAGEVYSHGTSVFVLPDGSVDKVAGTGGVEWTGVEFIRTVKDGVAMINIPSRIS